MKKQDTGEKWIQCTWRPLCAIVYLALCVWDFILAPIFFAWIQYNIGGNTLAQWQPLTMIGGGLIHLSFGGILGVSAWSRNIEKQRRFNRDYDERTYDEPRRFEGSRRYDDQPNSGYQHPYENR